jgi:CHAD domain-containing protein
MAVSSIPVALLEPRRAALAAHLPEAIQGGVRAVHQARVASRRLREALPVFGEPGGVRRLRRAVTRVRRVTRALGPVRELDVTLQLLAAETSRTAALQAPSRIVARLVAAERMRRRDAMRAVIDEREVRQTLDAVDAVMRRLAEQEDTGGWRPLLRARALRRADRLIERVYDVGLIFDPGRLHEVRIAAKKLRYTLEIVGEARLAPVTRLIGWLKRSQEQLGDLHDLQIVLAFVRMAEAEVADAVRSSITGLREQLERACHREHARYLRRRSRLLMVCEAVPGLLSRVEGDAPAPEQPATPRRAAS